MADRHQFRADWHDYNGGVYFVTICCAQKQHLFGKIISDPSVGTRFIASAIGITVEESIQNIHSYYDDVEIWNHVVMPNHIHLVIAILTQSVASTSDEKAAQAEKAHIGCLKPSRHQAPQSQNFHHNSRLASIVGVFKAGVTRQVRTRRIASQPDDGKIWQARFHEHIIRNQRTFDNIMNYIDTNVENWCYDGFNDNRIDNADAPWQVSPTTEASHTDFVRTRFIASKSINTPAFNKNILNADAKNRVPTFDNHEA